jgi:hypothetical protein
MCSYNRSAMLFWRKSEENGVAFSSWRKLVRNIYEKESK